MSYRLHKYLAKKKEIKAGGYLLKNSQKGFAHLGLILIFVAAIFFITATFFYVKNVQSNKRGVLLSDQAPPEACHDKDGLSMCLSTLKTQVSSSETAEIKTKITNKTDSDISQTFSCTFTDPSVILNQVNLSTGIVCGQAITNKVIKANSSESFTYKLSGSRLKTGANTVKSSWGSYESGEITLQKNQETNDEIADQFKNCQSLKDDIEFSDVPGYCASINIILKNSDAGQYSCNRWKDLFKKIDLKVPCTSVMDIGIGYIYVPRADANKYLGKVRSLGEVESASIDSQ